MVFPLIGALLGSSAGLTAAGAIGGALINAASTRRANKRNEELNDPAYARARLEAAGFNPLTKYGGYTAPTIMPNSAGSILASGLAASADQLQVDKQQQIELTRLEQQNDRLNEQLQSAKLNPHVGGIYRGQDFGGFPTGDNSTTGAGGNSDGDGVSPARGVTTGLDVGDATVTAVGDLGKVTYQDPRVMDTEMHEARYGDTFLQSLAGYRVVIKDKQYNIRLQELNKKYGLDFANDVHASYALNDGRDLKQVIYDLRQEYFPDEFIHPNSEPRTPLKINITKDKVLLNAWGF